MALHSFRDILQAGVVIPACPLALTAARELDERRQRALLRYYVAAGAGGVAAAVHTTQFAIRAHGLFKPVLALVADELTRLDKTGTVVRIAGLCGTTLQAVGEAETANQLGYHAGLLSLAALKSASDDELIDHCRSVSEIIPIFGFYLQPAVGGRVLSHAFWRRFVEIENVVAVKIAPFNRYQTLDVIRAVAESGREDVTLYTGNDDNIVSDLVTPFRFVVDGRPVERRIVGGLLGQWAVWTRKAVELLHECREAVKAGEIPAHLLQRGAELTDANAVIFDAGKGFAGCISGIHEVLRRQGLLRGTWCLDEKERLSPGQAEAIERVCRDDPHLNDDQFVGEHLADWLA